MRPPRFDSVIDQARVWTSTSAVVPSTLMAPAPVSAWTTTAAGAACPCTREK
jgi:hypothetical protein